MASKASLAVMFGFLLALILGTLTLFMPNIQQQTCGSTQTTYRIFNNGFLNITTGELVSGCTQGTAVEKIGWPVATKERAVTPGTLDPAGANFNVQPGGLIVNNLLFFAFGFIFFFIFSPVKRNTRNRTQQLQNSKRHVYR